MVGFVSSVVGRRAGIVPAKGAGKVTLSVFGSPANQGFQRPIFARKCNLTLKGNFDCNYVTFPGRNDRQEVAERPAPVKAEMNGLAPGLDRRCPSCWLVTKRCDSPECYRTSDIISPTNWDFIYSASLVIHPKNGKHESRHKRHDALESIREYSIFRPPHNTSQT